MGDRGATQALWLMGSLVLMLAAFLTGTWALLLYLAQH